MHFMHERLTPRNPLGQRSNPATNQATAESALGDDFGHERSDAADDRVRLDGDGERESGQHVSEIIRGCGMQTRDDDQARFDSVAAQSIGCGNGLARHATHADEYNVDTVAHDLHTAELKPTIESGDDGSIVFAKPEID